MTSIPPINALVDVVLTDGENYQSRIEDVDGRRMTVSAPFGVNSPDLPRVGSAMELAWVSGDRRHAVDVKLVALGNEQPPSWSLEAIGTTRLQTRRTYVRGGGGEGVEVSLRGTAYRGRIIDLSEGGLRCRLLEDKFDRDDRVDLRIALDNETIRLPGTVLFVRRDHTNATFDVIITYEVTELIRRAIRGYVLRREMEERRRARESVTSTT